MPKPSDITVLLVRSGRTEWDQAGRLQGKRDLPLSTLGENKLVACLGAVLAQTGSDAFSTIYSAPDEASRQTARVVAKQAGGKVRVLESLAAMDLGIWEGLRESDVHERFPSAYKQWREDPAQVTPPEGDSFVEVEMHVLNALNRAVEKAGEKGVALVLRPLEYGLARCLLMKRPTRDLWDLVEDGPDAEFYTVPRGTIRAMLNERKAST